MSELLRKKCGKCDEEKYLFEFNRSRATHDKLSHYCKECVNSDNRAYVARTQPKNVDKLTWKNDFRCLP